MKKTIIALCALGLLLCLNVIPVSAQDNQAKKIEEGKAYWAKWIEARGGRERLSAVKDYKTTADAKMIAQGLNATIITYKKGPNKFRVDQKVMGMTITLAIDVDSAWMIDPASGSVVDMPKEVRNQLAFDMGEHEALLNPEQFGHTVTYEGRKSILAKEYIVLNQAAENGVTATHYIDPETFLRYKFTSNLPNPAEIITSDYRDVDGIKVPFSIRQIQNGQEAAVISVTEHKFNLNLEDSLFERPAAADQKEITVSPKILTHYVGTYNLRPGLDLMITLEGDQLFAQASGQNKFRLSAESEAKFLLKVAKVEIEFVKDDKGVVTHLIHRQGGSEISAQRTSDKVLVRKEIAVSPEILAQYVGTYELKPGFDLVITLENDQLQSQASGQGKVPIFAETETKFFLKVVDAQIEFLKDETGAVTHLMLHQGPVEMKAPRK